MEDGVAMKSHFLVAVFVCLFCLGMALVGQAQCADLGRPKQMIDNPYFSSWAFGKPVGWSVIGNADCWHNERDGDTGVAMVEGSDSGLMQRVSVVPGKRYYYRLNT